VTVALISALSPSMASRLMCMKRNMKQIDLSVATGMTRSTISQIENGRQEVGLRIIEKLAKALEMPRVSLFRNL
jgi:transcriptional regulator with XRE-family HTH domain